MKILPSILTSVTAASLVLSLASCAGPETTGTEPSSWDTLIAAGDTMVARWEHDLVTRTSAAWPLAEVAPILTAADAAFCNLECCVALGSSPAEKGERSPFYYRARPEMLSCLTSAGIDIVTAANNHAGDYGPAGVTETLRWTEQAGLVCVGCGRDAADAERPRLVRIGKTRIALAGMDTTMSYSRATADRPGTSYAAEGEDLTDFRRAVKRIAAWSHGRCDLLFLTLHWGNNWVRAPSPLHRRMARIAFDNGVDVILGHSAHRLQGIEIIDGKVVLYDMGNLLFDCQLKPEGRQGALFRLHLSPAGVHRIDIIPTDVALGRTLLAGTEASAATLEEMERLCTPLGTSFDRVKDENGRARGILRIPTPRSTTRPSVPRSVTFTQFPAARQVLPLRADATPPADLPAGAKKLTPPAELAPGIQLLGYRLQPQANEASLLAVKTWWRVTRPVPQPWLLALELVTAGTIGRRGTPWYTRHDPGDWSLPLARMRPGEIVEDLYPARLAGLPPGPCEVRVLVLDPTRNEETRVVGTVHTLGTVQITPREKKK